MGFGVFDEAASDHVIRVPPPRYSLIVGRSFMQTKRRTQSGAATFETKLVDLGTKHVLARVRHPQTNGKLERFRLKIERYLKSFKDESASNTARNVRPDDHTGSPFHAAGIADLVARLVGWHNNLPHMSLMDGKETPAEAYVRKQAPKDTTTEEIGENLHAKA